MKRTVLLLRVLAWKQCLFVVEQPASSVMQHHPRFQELCAAMPVPSLVCFAVGKSSWHNATGAVFRTLQTFAKVLRSSMRMGCWGGSTPKPTKLWSNSAVIQAFRARKMTKDIRQKLAAKKVAPITKKYRDSRGAVRVHGCKGLKETQPWPWSCWRLLCAHLYVPLLHAAVYRVAALPSQGTCSAHTVCKVFLPVLCCALLRARTYQGTTRRSLERRSPT